MTRTPIRQTKQLLFVRVEWCTYTRECDSVSVFGKEKNESERIVQNAINNLIKGRTTIVIAHRLSTIHNSDKIFLLYLFYEKLFRTFKFF